MNSDPLLFGNVLLAVRIALHLVTTISIVAYSSENRTRPFSTILAICLAGTSLALATQGITEFEALSRHAEPWLVMFVGAVAVIVLYNGGNVAKILHQTRKWIPNGSHK